MLKTFKESRNPNWSPYPQMVDDQFIETLRLESPNFSIF
jgi:hypothetical protein